MSKSVLVTGASGQDGYYLLRLLHEQEFEVHAQSRKPCPSDQYPQRIQWHIGDPTDPEFLEALIAKVLPDEIYNLAAVSRPIASWKIPRETAELNAFLPQNICELLLKYKPRCRLFQASSSEIFGDNVSALQNEQSHCVPKTPYGVSKLYAHRIVGAYRQQYGLHACSGIMFNHESARRPLSFVSQKIAYAAAAASLGISETAETDERGQPLLRQGKITLGDISIRRDFGFAGDYVKAMCMILRHPNPDDYVVGTGEDHSIEEFCELAFNLVGLKWADHVILDSDLVRKVDSHYTRADTFKIRSTIRWQPTVSFRELVSIMLHANLEAIQSKLERR